MVFERKHENAEYGTPIGHIASVDSYINGEFYNNTNASGYINSEGCYYDPPPEDYFD